MKILALGDVVGERSLQFLTKTLPQKRRELGADLVIVNGENVCDIKGISPAAADTLIEHGADIITSGNHVFDRRDIYDYLDSSKLLLRPLNYPAEAPGDGARVVVSADGWQVLVLNVSGCAFMDALANPIASVERALDAHRGRYDLAVLDIHAEATSEKLAIARYFDGRVAVMFGTHTHVQTADEQILPKGSGYITDLGMTGPIDGILGVAAEPVITRNRTRLPQRFTVATGEIRASGALFEIDPATGRVIAVSRVNF
ncbi:MAG: YmdB family metallophosphoesterase [Clostridia bacterium]|nr:YmdB family metallophosphoesterase [Clostridia bacterium]